MSKIHNGEVVSFSSLNGDMFEGFDGTVQGRDGQILPGIVATGDLDALAAAGFMKEQYPAPINMFSGKPMVDEAAYRSWLSSNFRSGLPQQARDYYTANGNQFVFFSTTPDQVYAKNLQDYIDKDYQARQKRALALGLITISFSSTPRIPTTEEMNEVEKQRDLEARRARMQKLGLWDIGRAMAGQLTILTSAEMDKIEADRAKAAADARLSEQQKLQQVKQDAYIKTTDSYNLTAEQLTDRALLLLQQREIWDANPRLLDELAATDPLLEKEIRRIGFWNQAKWKELTMLFDQKNVPVADKAQFFIDTQKIKIFGEVYDKFLSMAYPAISDEVKKIKAEIAAQKAAEEEAIKQQAIAEAAAVAKKAADKAAADAILKAKADAEAEAARQAQIKAALEADAKARELADAQAAAAKIEKEKADAAAAASAAVSNKAAENLAAVKITPATTVVKKIADARYTNSTIHPMLLFGLIPRR